MKTLKERGPYCAISDHESSSMTLDELAIDARGLNCDFVDLSQGSLYEQLFISGGHKTNYCLVYTCMVLEIKISFEFSEYSHSSQRTKIKYNLHYG